ncbi:hypothetical protein [Leptolyngbya sp. CCY15150]|uniref:hypothetical protein n=1 Tax=Leptolyngbya sp. CCY15150 TaxID=2767772 RepID=UPI0019522B3B|nr:hypothetical protein [Leptolyngbya sp. CCY15150]
MVTISMSQPIRQMDALPLGLAPDGVGGSSVSSFTIHPSETHRVLTNLLRVSAIALEI